MIHMMRLLYVHYASKSGNEACALCTSCATLIQPAIMITMQYTRTRGAIQRATVVFGAQFRLSLSLLTQPSDLATRRPFSTASLSHLRSWTMCCFTAQLLVAHRYPYLTTQDFALTPRQNIFRSCFP